VLCTYGITSQIHFYKYYAALPLYNRSKVFKALNIRQIIVLEDINRSKVFKALNIRQIIVLEDIKGAEHHNICSRLMFSIGI
jgi:hypothetical protein